MLPTAIPVTASTQPMCLHEVHKAVKASKAEEKRVAFTQEQAESFSIIAPTLSAVFESLKTERRAKPMRMGKDPSATADAFIQDSNPVTKGLNLQKAEEEVTKLQSAQLLFTESHPLHPTIPAQLVEAQALVTKLSKDVPSPDLRASCLEEIVAAYKRAVRARKDRADKGREAA